LFSKIIHQTNNSVIFYCYTDVLKANNYSSVLDFPAIKNIHKNINLDTLKNDEVSFAILKIK